MAIDSKALTDWFNSSKKPTYEVKFPAFSAEEILRAQLADEASHKWAQDYVSKITKERLIAASTSGGTGIDLSSLRARRTKHVAGGARSEPSTRDLLDKLGEFVGHYRKEDFFTTGEVSDYAKTFTSEPKSEPEPLTATPVTKPPQGFDWT